MLEASRSAGAQSATVNATGCGFDPHSRKLNIYLNLYFHFFALVDTSVRHFVSDLTRNFIIRNSLFTLLN